MEDEKGSGAEDINEFGPDDGIHDPGDAKPVGKSEPRYPKSFKKCPVCGSTKLFTVECEREDFNPEEFKKRRPALQAFRHEYDHGLFHIICVVVTDSCEDCGAIVTVWRDKKKLLSAAMNPPGPRGPLFRGRG